MSEVVLPAREERVRPHPQIAPMSRLIGINAKGAQFLREQAYSLLCCPGALSLCLSTSSFRLSTLGFCLGFGET